MAGSNADMIASNEISSKTHLSSVATDPRDAVYWGLSKGLCAGMWPSRPKALISLQYLIGQRDCAMLWGRSDLAVAGRFGRPHTSSDVSAAGNSPARGGLCPKDEGSAGGWVRWANPGCVEETD